MSGPDVRRRSTDIRSVARPKAGGRSVAFRSRMGNERRLNDSSTRDIQCSRWHSRDEDRRHRMR
jgi:hypothetical protein